MVKSKRWKNNAIYESRLYLHGPIARIEIRISGHLPPRERRAIGVSFFRLIKPWLKYFRDSAVDHLEDWRADHRRAVERGIFIAPMAELQDSATSIALQIKLSRLQGFISQVELSEETGISRQQISNIERGLQRPRKKTFQLLTEAIEKLSPKKHDMKLTFAKWSEQQAQRAGASAPDSGPPVR